MELHSWLWISIIVTFCSLQHTISKCFIINFQLKSQLKQFINNYKDMSSKMDEVADERDEVSARQPQLISHDDVTTWKHFPHHWPFVKGIYHSPLNYPNRLLAFLIFAITLFLVITTVEQTVKLPVIWDAMAVMWRHCNTRLLCSHSLGTVSSCVIG